MDAFIYPSTKMCRAFSFQKLMTPACAGFRLQEAACIRGEWRFDIYYESDGGWTAERRDRLKLFQLDPSVEVSAVAAFFTPPD